MPAVRHIALLAALVAATRVGGQSTANGPTAQGVSRQSMGRVEPEAAKLIRYEPTGLSLLRHFARGKIPVVFVHGLWSSPWSWSKMVESLEADAALSARYQFWTYGYSTGDPLPYTASLLRRNFDDARQRFDPDHSDGAFDRMILVGHSMGGLITKMMAQETGTRLWQIVSDRPAHELAGDPADLDLFREALFYKPRIEVRRVVFIATPHRGSRVDQGPIGHLGSRLIRLPDPLRATYERLIARNAPDFFNERFRRGLPTSVDELEWRSPILLRLDEIGISPGIDAHSIIGDRRDPPKPDGSDGIVPYESAHLDGVVSELLVSAGHLCQDHPAVIREVRRILLMHEAL
jgi:pimeloyl-ACP methyl ester carboxylesterase